VTISGDPEIEGGAVEHSGRGGRRGRMGDELVAASKACRLMVCEKSEQVGGTAAETRPAKIWVKGSTQAGAPATRTRSRPPPPPRRLSRP